MRLTKLALSIALWTPIAVSTTSEVLSAQTTTTAATSGERAKTPVSRIKLDVQMPNYDLVKSSRARARFKKVWRTYSKAVDRFTMAEQSKSRTKSARLFQRASKGFHDVLKQIDRLRKFHGRDPQVRVQADRLRPQVEAASRTADIDLAWSYNSRGNYKMALDAVDRVLRSNPRDEEARRLREHVQILRSNGLGF